MPANAPALAGHEAAELRWGTLGEAQGSPNPGFEP